MADSIWYGTTSTAWATSANWSSDPTTGDHVRLVALYNNALAGSDQSSLALGDFIVEDGYSSTIGSKTINLKIDPNYFKYNGRGQAFIDLHSAAITAEVHQTAGASVGEFGLYLVASNLTDLSVRGGDVGIAARHNTSATIATASISGGRVLFGEGASLTTVNVYGGNVTLNCSPTTVNVYGGTLTLQEQAAITTLNLKGSGLVLYNSSGNITTATLDAGSIDCLQSSVARTISTLKVNAGSISYDPNTVTITTRSAPDFPSIDSTQRSF